MGHLGKCIQGIFQTLKWDFLYLCNSHKQSGSPECLAKDPRLKLIETDEFIKAARLKKGRGGGSAAKVLMTVLRINKINKLYEEINQHRGIDFIDALIDKLQLEFEVSEEELSKIPKEGAMITVSNHPLRRHRWDVACEDPFGGQTRYQGDVQLCSQQNRTGL